MTMKLVPVICLLLACGGTLAEHKVPLSFSEFSAYTQNMLREFPKLSNVSLNIRSVFNNPVVTGLMRDPEKLKTFLSISGVSPTCSQTAVYSIAHISSWTYNMIDATGKIPPAIQDGALQWVGGFKQCMNNPPPNPYHGNGRPPRSHYCKFTFGSPLLPSPPGFPPLSITMGICIPEACSSKDINTFLYTVLNAVQQNQTYIYIAPRATTCFIRQNEMIFSTAAIVMLVVCGISLSMVCLGTIYDLLVMRFRKTKEVSVPLSTIKTSLEMTTPRNNQEGVDNKTYDTIGDDDHGKVNGDINSNVQVTIDGEDKKVNGNIKGDIQVTVEPPKVSVWENVILSFSLYTNTIKVMDASSVPGRLGSLDGIRFLSMTWIIIGHTYFTVLGVSNNLVTYAPYILQKWQYQVIMNATFGVDSFFLLSGLLTAYMFLKGAKKMGSLANVKFWILYYFHRYWRLTPPYMLFMGLYTALMQYISNGHFWNQSTPTDGRNCIDNWWWNILYINNFIDRNKMCMGWSWYLANDMQFYFIVAPIMLVLIFYFGKWGALAGLPAIIGSMVATGVISRLNNFVGMEDPNGDQFNKLYIKPWCRVHVYIMGLLLGYLILEHKKRKWKLSPIIVVIGWVVAIVSSLGTLYSQSEVITGKQKFTLNTTALYNAVSRVTWALGLAWLIYACEAGYGSLINQFLSWKAFIPLSRLSYSAYLVHMIIQFCVYGSLQAPLILDDMTMVFLCLGFIVSSYGVAFMLTVVWESPFIRLERVLLGKH